MPIPTEIIGKSKTCLVQLGIVSEAPDRATPSLLEKIASVREGSSCRANASLIKRPQAAVLD